MRTHVDWRSASKENYKDFKKKHPNIKLTMTEWANIVYTFNEMFAEYILETGEKIKMPYGFGEFSINKKKSKKIKKLPDGREMIGLPIDWKKTKEKKKYIYMMNYHTEGYRFSWAWFKRTTRIKFSELWYFKASRVTSRMITHYIKTNEKYQRLYREWRVI